MTRWIVSRIKLALLTGSHRRLLLAIIQSDRLDHRLAKKKKPFKRMERQIALLCESVLEDLEEADRTHDQLRSTVDELRAEKQLLEETVVPGLTVAHQALVARLEAELAFAVRNQTLAQITERGSGYDGIG